VIAGAEVVVYHDQHRIENKERKKAKPIAEGPGGQVDEEKKIACVPDGDTFSRKRTPWFVDSVFVDGAWVSLVMDAALKDYKPKPEYDLWHSLENIDEVNSR
jgi:hypothetical protein